MVEGDATQQEQEVAVGVAAGGAGRLQQSRVVQARAPSAGAEEQVHSGHNPAWWRIWSSNIIIILLDGLPALVHTAYMHTQNSI